MHSTKIGKVLRNFEKFFVLQALYFSAPLFCKLRFALNEPHGKIIWFLAHVDVQTCFVLVHIAKRW